MLSSFFGDDGADGLAVGKGPAAVKDVLPVLNQRALHVERPGLGGIARKDAVIVLAHMQVQSVLLQGQAVVGHALQVAEDHPVGDGQAAQGRVVVVLADAGVVLRDPGENRADIPAAVDGQGCAVHSGRHVRGIGQGFLPDSGGLVNLPPGVGHPDPGQVAGCALQAEAHNGVAQGVRVIGDGSFACHAGVVDGQGLRQGVEGQQHQQQGQGKEAFHPGSNLSMGLTGRRLWLTFPL